VRSRSNVAPLEISRSNFRFDIGTWSNSITAFIRVLGLVEGQGFKATLLLPVSSSATHGGQFPIGGPERWQQIVDNLAALVARFDQSFVPQIEAVSGPAPVWFLPRHGGPASKSSIVVSAYGVF
jgi:hypothetical protein